jgi:hypothetical protein
MSRAAADRRLLVPVQSTPSVDSVGDLRTLVTVTRTDPDDWGLRQVVVRLDEQPKVTLLFSQTVTLDIMPGRHRLRAHNTLMWRTVEFVVEAGEHLEFSLVNRRGWLLQVLLGFFPAPLVLNIARRCLR